MSFTRFLWVLVLASGLANAADIDGTITYQAQIKQNGAPANGTFDFQFKLFDSASVGTGAQSGQTVFVDNAALVNGQLSSNLNFGATNPFTGTQLFLEIGIRDGSSNSAYTLLNPRQRLTEVPYASHSVESEIAFLTGANSVNSGSVVDGSIGFIDVNTTQIQRRVTGTCPAGSAVSAVAENGTVTCATFPTGGGGGSGTVTSITAGSGLAGGIITTSGTISIATGGVGTSQINATQVQRRNSAMATACSGINQSIKTIAEDGSVTCETDDTGGGSSGGWNLTGNAGTTAGTNFIGTTDDQPIVIKTAGRRAAQYTFATGMVNAASPGDGINVLQGDPINTITAGVLGGTIAGGGRHPSGSSNPNAVTDAYGTVGGGYGNTAGSNDGTVTDAIAATIGGGHANLASNHDATVAGGAQNTASGIQSTVGGGNFNVASGQNALIPGGRGNNATGNNTVVLGNCGTASAAGAVLIVAQQNPSACNQVNASTGAESVTVIAGGGGVVLSQGSGSWASLSDRNSKHGVVPVNSDSILAGVLAMPIATWTYNTQADAIRHMGPMAQDFHAAFSLGEDEKRINSVDIDGVALAAIQGLNAKVERENEQLKQQNAALEAKNTELEQRLIRLEQTLLGTEHTAGR